jgi:putative phage-type endonuclease
MIQGSDEWLRARLGRVTASRVADVVAKTKSGYSASRQNYLAELICERLTGEPQERFVTGPMQRGTEKEPEARAFYELMTGVDVEQVGFVEHPTIPMSGASPDGLVGDVGLIEIKAPNTAAHIETLISKRAPSKYHTQMQWQMACQPERLWVDFMSYDDRISANMQSVIIRVPRDNDRIAELEEEVIEFLKEVDEKIADLNSRYGVK